MKRNDRGAAASPEVMDRRVERLCPGGAGRRGARAVTTPLPGLGMLLLALAAGTARADVTEERTERFNASLEAGATVRVHNISGDIVATPGRELRVHVQVAVTAPTAEQAREILERVQVVPTRAGADYVLETRWPRAIFGWERRGDGRVRARCKDCRISARYELTIPPGVAARLETVNGEVRVRDLEGDLTLRAVNGRVEAAGVRRSLDAQTVNGMVEAAASAVAPGASFDLQTVNGAVRLTLPRDAKFRLAASTMNGAIASTFALPASSEDWVPEEIPAIPHAPRPAQRPRSRQRAVVIDADGTAVELGDLKRLERELEESLREVEVEIQDAGREVRRIRVLGPRSSYRGAVGAGSADVRLRSLNGAITLLASGTRESDAKSLVPRRRSFVVTVPDVRIRLPNVRVVVPEHRIRIEREPRPHPAAPGEEEIVRGDVDGNFLATRGGGSYRIGKVSGTVKILSHSGEIRVASAGAGADLKTLGGDIKIDSVTGTLRAHTGAGDIRAGAVSGALFAETSGGDIRAGKVDGAVTARTAGGDIVLAAVGGSVQAVTAGGLIRIGVAVPLIRGGVAIRNDGGDVSLTLPADFRANLELVVTGRPGDERLVRSDFPELAVTRRIDGVSASGTLNGGGPKVVVRTSSGAIRLRKGPPAGG